MVHVLLTKVQKRTDKLQIQIRGMTQQNGMQKTMQIVAWLPPTQQTNNATTTTNQ